MIHRPLGGAQTDMDIHVCPFSRKTSCCLNYVLVDSLSSVSLTIKRDCHGLNFWVHGHWRKGSQKGFYCADFGLVGHGELAWFLENAYESVKARVREGSSPRRPREATRVLHVRWGEPETHKDVDKADLASQSKSECRCCGFNSDPSLSCDKKHFSELMEAVVDSTSVPDKLWKGNEMGRVDGLEGRNGWFKSEILMCKTVMSDGGAYNTFIEGLRPGVMLVSEQGDTQSCSEAGAVAESMCELAGAKPTKDEENSSSSQEVASTDRGRIKPSGNHGKTKSVSKKKVSSKPLKCYFCDGPHMIRGCPEKNRLAAIVRKEDKSEGEVAKDGAIAGVKAVKPGARLGANASGAGKLRVNKRDPLKCFLCQGAHRARSCPNAEKLGANASGEAGKSRAKKREPLMCFQCGGKHKVRDCTNGVKLGARAKGQARKPRLKKQKQLECFRCKGPHINQKQNELPKPNVAKELAKDAEEVAVVVEAGVGKEPKESKTFQEQSSSVHAESEAWSKLMNLRHEGTLKEYVREFEELMLQVPELTGEDVFFTFTDGLKPWAKVAMNRRRIKELSKALIAAESIIELGVKKTSKPKLKAEGNDKSIRDEGQSNNDEEQGSSSDACSSEVCSNGEHLSTDRSSGEHMSIKDMYNVGTSKANKCLTPRTRKEHMNGRRSKGPQELQACLDKAEWSEKMEKPRIELPKDMGEDKRSKAEWVDVCEHQRCQTIGSCLNRYGATDLFMSKKDADNLGLKVEPSKGASKDCLFQEVPSERNIFLGTTIEETTEKRLMESRLSRDMMSESLPPMLEGTSEIFRVLRDKRVLPTNLSCRVVCCRSIQFFAARSKVSLFGVNANGVQGDQDQVFSPSDEGVARSSGGDCHGLNFWVHGHWRKGSQKGFYCAYFGLVGHGELAWFLENAYESVKARVREGSSPRRPREATRVLHVRWGQFCRGSWIRTETCVHRFL
ncbi:hypothetical protein F3Y22_tig00111691pilonHSYRG00010 [Hibiscus syriacus]|uniref:CCHC-type domain-containing protein n=1 Tax=Hibiscus syriacus TaxID=106335 RepID=A0A6A2YBK6_HIBSY|nr:hypothetical protein F3Y22_tig00111691pilonHSYRG00010 [Hibiscus syriacus]